MLQRFWSCFRSDNRNKRTGIKEKYIQLDDLMTINSRTYEHSIENPNEVQECYIPTEKAFKCIEEHKNYFSSSHEKLVKILNKHKNENLDKYTKKQVKAVMKKAYPILEKIFLKESIQKFYTSWLAFFYALTAKHSQFNDLFKDLWDESWRKSDQSQLKKGAYYFICMVSQDNRWVRRLLRTEIPCYWELKEEVKQFVKEIKSRTNCNN